MEEVAVEILGSGIFSGGYYNRKRNIFPFTAALC